MSSAAKDFHDMMADKLADKDDGDGDEPPDYAAGYKAAVESFIAAVHDRDTDAASKALQTAVSLCGKMGDDEPDGDEGGSGGHAALLLMPHPKG